jgi:hypothetical protein
VILNNKNYKTDNESGKLRLHSPVNFSNSTTNEYLDIQPEDGMMVMFPAWMGHEILPTISENIRISIAFNLI